MSSDPPSRPDLPNPEPAAPSPDPEPTAPSRNALRQERRVRDLILDYALGTSILGLIPIPRAFTLKLVLALGLVIKMIWDISKLWRFQRGQDLLAIAGVFFGILGALAMAFMAWLTFLGVGVVVPYVKGLALAAALFTLVWGTGQAVNQFYANGAEQEKGV